MKPSGKFWDHLEISKQLWNPLEDFDVIRKYTYSFETVWNIRTVSKLSGIFVVYGSDKKLCSNYSFVIIQSRQFANKTTFGTACELQHRNLVSKPSSFIHQLKSSTSQQYWLTTFACCHDILVLMTVDTLSFSGKAASAVPTQPPSLLLLSRLPLINTVDYQLK